MPSAKLTPAQVVELRKAYAGGASQPELARRYGLTQGGVSHIVRGNAYPDAGGPIAEPRYGAKLTEEHVAAIRRLCATKTVPQNEIARMYGISQSQVSRIRTGVNWLDADA